ncbi:hypothetical protein M3O44_18385 [Xanthomonas nasturtii]|nr:hypothetical protein [Xanthomonas nasturtii]
MATAHNPFLLVAAGLNALAALLHLGCIAAGPAGYRLLGAGDGMAQMASAGHWYPTVVTLIIVSILLVWPFMPYQAQVLFANSLYSAGFY